jgi:hypothetical protein
MPDIPAEFLAEELASPKQVKFALALMEQRDLFKLPGWFDAVNAMDQEEYARHVERVKAGLPNMPRRGPQRIGKFIDALLECPEVPGQAAGERDNDNRKSQIDFVGLIPDGRYALVNEDDVLNPVRFYQVKRGNDYRARGGRDWTNFLFVTRFSSDEEWPVKGADRIAVLTEIAFDPKTAAIRFGREENRCCICYKRLTRRLSRDLGIGPVCGGRNGWINAEVLASARERIRAEGFDPEEEVS